MAISPELVPEFKEAYRAATGIDRETVREEALKALHKSKGLRRILGYIGESLGVGPTHPKTGNLQNWAYNRVRLLSNCQPGLYPRDARRGIAYNIDVYQQEFQYGFVFPGKMVGESGQLNFSYRSEQIWLRRGAKALFEVAKISRDERAFMKHILHLPEREGIAIRFASRCSSPVGVAYGGGIIPLATWYPDLSDNPVPYLYPFGGKIIWNTHRD